MPSAESGFGSRALAGLLLVAVLSFGLGACGRRGQPEPPVDPSAPKTSAPPARSSSTTRTRQDASGNDAPASPTTVATRPNALASTSPDADDDEDAIAEDPNRGVSPQPTPSTRKRNRAYDVPKEPFFLDPLL